MATYEIEVLEKADEDMRLLGKYISGELQSPMAAERITDKIWDEIEKLAKNPYVYQVYIPLSSLKQEYRKVLVENYHVKNIKRHSRGNVFSIDKLYLL